MKLKQFEPTRSRGSAAIILSSDTSRVIISSSLAKHLNLHHGDKVAFHQDAENPSDWYIEPGSLTGFRVRSRGGSTGFVSRSLSKAIKESLGKSDGDKVMIPVATTPETPDGYKPMYALLTRAVR